MISNRSPDTALNLHDFFLSVKRLMIITGIYCYNDWLKPQILFQISKCVNWLLAIILFSGMICKMCKEIDDLLKTTETLYIFFTELAYILKLVNYTLNKRKTIDLERFLDHPDFIVKTKEQKELLHVPLDVSTKIIGLYRISCFLVILLYLIIPVITGELPLPGWYPIDMKKYFYELYIFQVMAIGSGALNNCCMDCLTIQHVSMGTAQLKILTYNLTTSTKSASKKDSINALIKCIYHHNTILKYIAKLESHFSYGIFFQFGASVGVICISGFLFLVTPLGSPQFFVLIVYLGCMMTQIAMYCWFGNELMFESTKINESCYLSEWYTKDVQFKKSMFILMERSKKPLKVTAGNFFSLTLETFSTILRSSYSYFALLRRVYSDDSD